MIDQCHLKYKERVNLGSYYTKPELVSLVYQLIRKNVKDRQEHILLDTSCGYGSFLRENHWNKKRIGADIDENALKEASSINPDVYFIHKNALNNVSREQYQLSAKDKIIIVGNPPYNDTTSIIRNNIKQSFEDIDPLLKTRDLGMSFLLSYNKLFADYICVLHPLSYLIKRANFALLKPLSRKYKLVDSIIISSGEFTQTSKTTYFPIIIALYRKDDLGMDYKYIKNYHFRTKEGKKFQLSNFDSISNYLTKYPNQKYVNPSDAVAKFWTMRDINALKRSRTFIRETTTNTILVTKKLFDYYCYVDVFKKFIPHIPYYFGNCDVMINNEEFLRIKDDFRRFSLAYHPYLKSNINFKDETRFNMKKINDYFLQLLGEHYVY